MEIWYQVYTNDGTPNFGFAIEKSKNTGQYIICKYPNNANIGTVGIIHVRILESKGYSIMRITKLPNETVSNETINTQSNS